MIYYIKYIIRDFIGIGSDYESLLSSQEELLKKLNSLENISLENQKKVLEAKEGSSYDYLTLKNLIWFLVILAFLGCGFWLYNADFFNNSILESIKDLGNLSKELYKIDHKGILEALKKLNEDSVNLSKEEVKLLLEIKDLLLKKGIDENSNLSKPVNMESTIGWGDFKD